VINQNYFITYFCSLEPGHSGLDFDGTPISCLTSSIIVLRPARSCLFKLSSAIIRFTSELLPPFFAPNQKTWLKTEGRIHIFERRTLEFSEIALRLFRELIVRYFQLTYFLVKDLSTANALA